MTLPEFGNQIAELADSKGFEVLLTLMAKIENLPSDTVDSLKSKYEFLMSVYSQCRILEHKLNKSIRDFNLTSGESYRRHNWNVSDLSVLRGFFIKFYPLRNQLESELSVFGIDPKTVRHVEHLYNPSLAGRRTSIMKALDKHGPIDYHKHNDYY